MRTLAAILWFALIGVGLTACGGNDDPVLKQINDATADVDFDDFYVDRSDIYPGETVMIEWQASGAIYFDATLYASLDDQLSNNDKQLVDEECGIEHDDHCTANEFITFYCAYKSDNSFNCREDGELLQRNDLTHFFTELPQDSYLILQLCSDGDCDTRSWPMLFR